MITDELGEVMRCTVEGCEKDASAKGFCITHYKERNLGVHHKTPEAKKVQQFLGSPYPSPAKPPEPEKPKGKACLKCGREKKIVGRGPCGACYFKVKALGKLDELYPAKWGAVAPKQDTAAPLQEPPKEEPHNCPLPGFMQEIIRNTLGMVTINLDLVPGLKDYIEALAARELRTVEAQALYMLKGAMGFDMASRPRCSHHSDAESKL